jgi:hypothetical protein
VADRPILSERDRDVANLTQFPILDRAVITDATRPDFPPPATAPLAVDLPVPPFAADQTAAHRRLHAV